MISQIRPTDLEAWYTSVEGSGQPLVLDVREPHELALASVVPDGFEVIGIPMGVIPVRLTDERLTTVSAARALRESGVRAKGQRQVIDQAAAVSILQGWLDERSNVKAQDSGGDK